MQKRNLFSLEVQRITNWDDFCAISLYPRRSYNGWVLLNLVGKCTEQSASSLRRKVRRGTLKKRGTRNVPQSLSTSSEKLRLLTMPGGGPIPIGGGPRFGGGGKLGSKGGRYPGGGGRPIIGLIIGGGPRRAPIMPGGGPRKRIGGPLGPKLGGPLGGKPSVPLFR